MILSVPPQHGKSELASRRLPAQIFGKNPDKRIAGVSYNSTFASKFNRDIQRIITSQEYTKIYPGTTLNGKNVATNASGSWLRNATEFEIVGRKGSYLSVGIGGALTGNRVDVGIIDDPYKDAMQAWSPTYRKKVWDWYTTTFLTRLHNESQQLLIMTRWHEEDLAGKLIKMDKDLELPESERWVVVNLPAILELEADRTPGDSRELGEALWESQHSLKTLKGRRKIDKVVFSAMYQGKPAPAEGSVIKTGWFNTFTYTELVNHSLREKVKIVPVFYVDGAETTNKKNDPSAILCGVRIGNIGYILDVARAWHEFHEWLDWFKIVVDRNGYDPAESWIYIEPKSMGKSAVSQVRNTTMYNVEEATVPTDSKLQRAQACVPIWRGKRIKLLAGATWIEPFSQELQHFTGKEGGTDDQVDTLVMFTMDQFPVDEIWAELQGGAIGG